MNPVFLLIETSSPICSIAIADKNGIVAIKEEDSGLRHAALAPLFVHDLMKIHQPDAVVISAGPGSYTGLRIGTSLAKGICYGQDIPLIAVSTLKAMVDGFPEKQQSAPDTLFIPMLDARRMEVYTAVYNREGNKILPVQPMILDKNSFNQLIDKSLVLFGSGSIKAQTLWEHKLNCRFAGNFHLSAKHLLPQAIKKFDGNQFEDLGYFEPFYLKNFMVTTSQKKFF